MDLLEEIAGLIKRRREFGKRFGWPDSLLPERMIRARNDRTIPPSFNPVVEQGAVVHLQVPAVCNEGQLQQRHDRECLPISGGAFNNQPAICLASLVMVKLLNRQIRFLSGELQ